MGFANIIDHRIKTQKVSSAMSSDVIKVSVIIVNYNVRNLLRQCLLSVERSLINIPSEIIVVDNNSVDGSVSMVTEEFPNVTLIANPSNTGFSTANNQGLHIAGGEYILILNPDTIVEEETIQVFLDFMLEHQDAGAVGCRILHPDGSFALESRRSFPTPTVAFYRMTGLSRLFPHSKIFGRYNLTFLPEDQVTPVDALSGSCMFLRRSALFSSDEYPSDHEVAGLFDEGFFMYGEDLDLCYRIQKAGWNIYYTPETQIIHYKGESTKKGEIKYTRLFYGAMTRFAEKHLSEDYPRAFLWILHLAVIVRASLSVMGNMLRHHAMRDLVICYGIITGLGLLRSFQTGLQFPPIFYWGLCPLFSLIIIGVIAIWGGYRGTAPRIGLVLLGSCIAVTSMAALSFFVKQIAFSRMVILASLPACLLFLSAIRLMTKTHQRRQKRTLIVGNVRDAYVLSSHPLSQHLLVGMVTQKEINDIPAALKWLGNYDQLREIVRIHHIESVIFSTAELTNKEIFALIQQLSGISLKSYILADAQHHLIGKSSIQDLDRGTLFDAEEVIGSIRSPAARRLSDIIAALAGAIIHPFVSLLSRISGPQSRWFRRYERTRQWMMVLSGKRSLIGYHDDDEFTPLPEWQLPHGVFTVSEMLGPKLKRPQEEIEQAHWYYVRNQSAIMDWMIAVRALRGSI